MKSALFFSGEHARIEAGVRGFLNRHEAAFLSEITVKSTRAVGDAIQDIIADNFETILGPDICSNYSSNFARRAMADVAFEDKDGFYYVVDVKTHRISTKFNMPNLTSVERIARFYEDDRNYFAILMIGYEIEGVRAVVSEVMFVPIEFLGWDCLTVGALGWGQVQIANSNRITINHGYSRKQWMIELCDVLLDFYPKELSKIGARIKHFQALRDLWMERPD